MSILDELAKIGTSAAQPSQNPGTNANQGQQPITVAPRRMSGEERAERNTPAAPKVDVLSDTLKNLGLLNRDYDAKETEYKAAQDAYTKAMQNAPADADFDTYLKPYRDRANAAEAALRSSRQNYENAGGIGHSYSGEDRVSDIIKGGLGDSGAGAVNAAGSIYEGNVRGATSDWERELQNLRDQRTEAIQTYRDTLQRYGGDENNRNVQAALRQVQRISEDMGMYNKALRGESDLLNTANRLYDTADNLSAASARDVARAKEGLGTVGQFAVDAGVAGVQMLGDAAIGAATGTGMLPVMGLRSYGSAAQEARQAGADYEGQALYGIGSAAVEMLTEKIADGLAGLAGKGAADDVAEEVIRRLASSDTGRTVLRQLYGMSGEALEEAISSLSNPALRALYDKGAAAKESYGTAEGRKALLADTAYDSLVGAALGGAGSLGSVATGQNRAKNTDLRLADAGFGGVDNQVNDAWDVLNGRTTAEQQQARERAAQQRLGILDLIQPTQAAVETVPVQEAAEAPAEAPQPVAPESVPAESSAAESATAPVLNGEETAARTIEDRIAENQRRMDEINRQLDNLPEDIADEEVNALVNEGMRLDQERRALDIEATQQARVQNNEVSREFGKPENHIDNRTNASVASQKVKAFQFDHPELHDYFVEAAKVLADQVMSAETNTLARAGQKGSAVKRGPVRMLMDLGMTKPRIMQCLNDIIQNNGAENYADAKRVEIVLNDMMTNGWIGLNRQTHDGNPDYIAAKEKITGAVKSDSWEKYLADREWMISTGDATEEQLRAEWEAQHPEAANPEPPSTPAAPAANNSGEGGPSEYIPPVNEGAKPREVESQSHSIEGQMNVYGQDYEAPRHITKPEIESLTNAINRASSDMNGETQKLLNKDSWTGEDIDTAMVINGKLLIDAIKNNDFAASDAWLKVLEQHKQEAGRSLQALSKWARGGKAAVQEANTMLAEAKDVSPEQRAATMNQVQNYAERFDAIQDGDLDSLRKLILEMNDDRGTGTLIKSNFERFLNKETDFDYLKEFALRQLMAIPGDVTNKSDLGQRLKTWQSIAQLLRVTTTLRNVLGNESFGIVDLIPQSSVGWLLDSLVGAIDGTGVHTVGPDVSWLNSNARKAMGQGINRSMMEIAADVYMGGENAYSTQGLRTNKASGNVLERMLSRAEQLSGYALTTTDVAASERQATSYVDMLNRMNNGKLTPEQMQELARNITDYRLFKNKGVARNISQWAHDTLNIIGIGGEGGGKKGPRRGGFGLAEVLGLNYPGVPANLGVKALEYSPLNAAKGLYELVKYGIDTKNNGTPDLIARQNAVMDFSRGITGTALIAACAQLFASGILRYYDDEDDYDVITQNKAEGKTGTLINVSALGRMLSGGSPEWQDTDKVMNIAYLQPINSLFAISHYISKDKADGETSLGSLAGDFWKGSWNGLLDMPVMQSISSLADVIGTKYDEETGGSKLFDAAATVASNAVTGMIPGISSQVAKAGDKFERDTSGDTVLDWTINTAKKSIPGLRETLPIKYDSFGNPIEYGGSTYDRIMNALVRPGTISTIKQSETSKLIEDLIAQTGDKKVMPDASAPYKVKIGGDNLDLTAEERREFHKNYGQAVSKYIAEQMDLDSFQHATPETQAEVIKDLEAFAKDRAKAAFAEKRGLEYSSDYQTLLNGKDAPGTSNDVPALKEKDAGEYIAFNTAYSSAQKDSDYSVIDDLLKQYSKLDSNTQAVLTAKNPKDLKNLLAFNNAGSGSESYYKIKSAIGDAQWDLDATSAQGSHVRMAGLADADVSTAEKDKLVDSGAFKLSGTAKSTYGILRDFGMQPKDISQWFENADWYASGTGKDPKADGSLNAYEVATAISKIPNLSDQQRNAMYQQFKQAIQRPNDAYDSWKEKSYTQALRQSTSYGRVTGKGAEMPSTAEAPEAAGQTQNVIDYLLSLGRAN